VKFSTDLTNYGSIQKDGVYLEMYANTDTTEYLWMTNEAGTNVYSIVLDLPANKLYTFKFSDGNDGYTREFVPGESRLICTYCDNDENNDTVDQDNSRWIYVDSIVKPVITSVAPTSVGSGQTYTYTVDATPGYVDDTLYTGAILFGENAPAGKYLVRFVVDMKYQPVSSAGAHLAGSFQDWNLRNFTLYSIPVISNTEGNSGKTFNTTTYEGIAYLDAGTYEYKFYQGNTEESAETVPSGCATTSGNRSVTVSGDVVIDAVCFSVCGTCSSVSESSVTKVTSTPAGYDDFVYTLADAPSGMSISNNVVTWTPGSATTSGAVTLTASNDSYSDTETFTVNVSTIEVTSITLSETSLALALSSSSTVILTATVLPSNAGDKTVTWSSSNTDVAIVGGGYVTAVGDGTAVITATANDGSGVKATCTVTVGASSSAGEVGGNTISVYPNPCKEYAVVDLGSVSVPCGVILVNVYGQQVRKCQAEAGAQVTIDRGNLPAGVYYIIASKDGVILFKDTIIFE